MLRGLSLKPISSLYLLQVGLSGSNSKKTVGGEERSRGKGPAPTWTPGQTCGHLQARGWGICCLSHFVTMPRPQSFSCLAFSSPRPGSSCTPLSYSIPLCLVGFCAPGVPQCKQMLPMTSKPLSCFFLFLVHVCPEALESPGCALALTPLLTEPAAQPAPLLRPHGLHIPLPSPPLMPWASSSHPRVLVELKTCWTA